MRSLDWAHPVVRDWFVERFSTPTEPQESGWPVIVAGRNVLISAPTGSGKTLAAFLACIDALVRKSLSGELEARTEVVYVSPLKALSNDINKNLEGPLAEILELARSRALNVSDIRTAVRTGDTLAAERRSMLKSPPHILVTTPESLYILLTAEKSRKVLEDVSTVIVDEIHAVAGSKRGSHLALTLERLDALARRRPVRIGLSATQKPIGEIGLFLKGGHEELPEIIEVGQRRQLDLAVESPDRPLEAVASHEMWEDIYDRIAGLVQSHNSTLVFVNTRRLAERLAHQLSDRLSPDVVGCHHGSLSRELRLSAESRLKAGELKVLVATASLELGIDVGGVDLVCQIGSPRNIAVALQRVGRAGHWRGAIPKGRFFATTRDELIECAALVKAIGELDLDRIVIPERPYDILAQQIVAECASRDCQEDELFDLVRGAYPYRDLSRDEYENILEMLSEGVAGRKTTHARFLHRDRINHRLAGRRGARLVAITNGGAIPDNALFTVVVEPDETVVGTLDEDFAIESNRGDIILLGNTSWRVKRVESLSGRVRVEDARGASPSVPFWLGEAPGRTVELSRHVAELRQEIADAIKNGTTFDCLEQSLMERCSLTRESARQAIDYIREGMLVLGTVPTQDRIVAERFFDESGGMQLIIHAPFGARINKAWGLALRKRFCRSFDLELQASATDEGINISLTEQHSFPLADVFNFLHTASIRHVLEQTALVSPLFPVRWRWDASRSLALLRFFAGKKVPPHLQRMKSEDLLAAVFPQAAACQDNVVGDISLPDHPLTNEVMKDVLNEAMDLDGLTGILDRIERGEIECVAVDTVTPSAFSAEILNANPYAYLDDAPLEERRARAVEMRRVLPDSIVREFGALDPGAIDQVCRDASPDIRNSDELYDLLMTLVILPGDWPWVRESETLQGFFLELENSHRAIRLQAGGRAYLVAVERERAARRLFDGDLEIDAGGDIVEQAVAGWLMHLGPVTARELQDVLSIEASAIATALGALESRGLIMQGNFVPGKNSTQWCERGLLARIHRLTLGSIRKQIEPVSRAQFMDWLFSWQHLAEGSRLAGEHGVLAVFGQLDCFEIPANAWESQILKRRVREYKSDFIDKLCLTGQIGWARISRHPAFAGGDADSRDKRILPASNSPVAFYLREKGLLLRSPGEPVDTSVLSVPAAKVLAHLENRGASFFVDLVRLTGLLPAEIEAGLWELVTAGLVTADGFDNLRALIDPRRRAGQGRYKKASRPRHSQGRWTVVETEPRQESDSYIESVCFMLLKRYGVIFRELLARENNLPAWREMLMCLRRLEAQGKIRGGRFVSGFIGEQFALKPAVESLRASRKNEGGRLIQISACDPLNLVGIVVPGQKIPANSGKTIVFEGGAFRDAF
ncbi:MAG: DEAD/DEAH box helicase [Candidatus Obscuribacterales bacterium]